MSERIKIQHPSGLNALASWRIKPARRPAQVDLQVEGMSPRRVETWERQLTRLQSPCGCDQGAAGLLLGAIGYPLYLALRPGGWGHPASHELWIGVCVIFLTTSLGKAMGILMARRRLRRVIREIQTEWKPQPVPERDFRSARSVQMQSQSSCCGGGNARRMS